MHFVPFLPFATVSGIIFVTQCLTLPFIFLYLLLKEMCVLFFIIFTSSPSSKLPTSSTQLTNTLLLLPCVYHPPGFTPQNNMHCIMFILWNLNVLSNDILSPLLSQLMIVPSCTSQLTAIRCVTTKYIKSLLCLSTMLWKVTKLYKGTSWLIYFIKYKLNFIKDIYHRVDHPWRLLCILEEEAH